MIVILQFRIRFRDSHKVQTGRMAGSGQHKICTSYRVRVSKSCFILFPLKLLLILHIEYSFRGWICKFPNFSFLVLSYLLRWISWQKFLKKESRRIYLLNLMLFFSAIFNFFRFIVKPNDSIVVHGSEIFKAIMRALGLNGRTIQYAMEYIKMTPFQFDTSQLFTCHTLPSSSAMTRLSKRWAENTWNKSTSLCRCTFLFKYTYYCVPKPLTCNNPAEN